MSFCWSFSQRRAVLPLTLLVATLQAVAAEKGGDGNDAQPGSGDPFSSKWNILLGAGAINGPRYPGSNINFTRGFPAVSATYGRYFLGAVSGGGAPAGLGAYLVRTEHWTVGVDVGGGAFKPRRASDAPILHGWGSIPGTVHGGMFASYSIEWLSVRGAVSGAGHNEGVAATLGFDANYRVTSRFTLSIGPEVTWVDGQNAMTFFGIDAAQSKIAGVAPYRARSGINAVMGQASARYMLTNHWSLGAHASYGRLQGDAANSPVTADKTQRVYAAFVMYHF